MDDNYNRILVRVTVRLGMLDWFRVMLGHPLEVTVDIGTDDGAVHVREAQVACGWMPFFPIGPVPATDRPHGAPTDGR